MKKRFGGGRKATRTRSSHGFGRAKAAAKKHTSGAEFVYAKKAPRKYSKTIHTHHDETGESMFMHGGPGVAGSGGSSGSSKGAVESEGTRLVEEYATIKTVEKVIDKTLDKIGERVGEKAADGVLDKLKKLFKRKKDENAEEAAAEEKPTTNMPKPKKAKPKKPKPKKPKPKKPKARTAKKKPPKAGKKQ